jgi:hypothetical protein
MTKTFCMPCHRRWPARAPDGILASHSGQRNTDTTAEPHAAIDHDATQRSQCSVVAGRLGSSDGAVGGDVEQVLLGQQLVEAGLVDAADQVVFFAAVADDLGQRER